MNQNEKVAFGVVALGVVYLYYKIYEICENINAIDTVVYGWMKEEEQELFDEKFEEIIDENQLEE